MAELNGTPHVISVANLPQHAAIKIHGFNSPEYDLPKDAVLLFDHLEGMEAFCKVKGTKNETEKEAKEANETIKQAMIDAGVERIEFDPELTGISGYITLATRKNYKVVDADELPDEFKTLSPDTAKVKAHEVLTGELPAGVETSETQYITKKIKLED